MSDTQLAAPAQGAAPADYWRLAKPRVVALITFTAVAGMAFAAAATGSSPGPQALLGATLGIALAAAGAAVANCLLERRVDSLMRRTMNRATATGRVAPLPAATLSATLLALGIAMLQAYANTLTTALTLATFVGYAFVYTVLLKPNTPQNIVIGGASGAMPPVLGWTAVTGSLDYQPLLLFLVVFVWTPPHFWSLALSRMSDYRASGMPMLPVTHGEPLTRLHVFLYSVALAAVSLLPFAAGMAGWIYLAVTLLANARFCQLAWRLLADGGERRARALFSYSCAYLVAVFAALMADAVARVA